MVYYSGGRAARNAASIVNRANAGGPKKAGLRPTSGYYFLSSRPSAMLSCAPQLPIIPVGDAIPCFPISRTTQTQSYGYRATIGGNMG
jgi:hypothetical protein